ncbi:PREDICTED: GPI mannosyltransferase 3 isoform X1 [Populus euphratica]|uniref:Mannosyltransferase n=1 Tax=Populus euphratica TaxID=75702 RepID=A0AAJ6TWM7_POPEU|nr:PREDICTED: GPI mannosyltransferase 3 isoform X1 [Populus euphratica]XP_011018111.1 PREDICTED: GPI mannosyltransferase 3 isoform X1 [Populus euphratica]
MNQRRNASSKSQPTTPLINKNPDVSKHKVYTSQKSNFFSSEKNIFTLCLAFRIANSLLIQTYFNPDEHWQALEVAHRIVFGYGHLTWEWRKEIRSYFHPLVFAVLYKVLALFGLDTPWFMAHAPRLLQALFSAVGDLYFYKLSNAIFGNFVAKWALFSQLANWFMFFCFNRTLSNSLETVLTLVGLYYWPCMRASPSKVPLALRKWGLTIAALACAIRPTSAITWVYVGLLELAVTRDRLKFLALEVVPIGAFVLALSCLLDRLMYGSWVIVPLNFLKFNFLSSGGDYYGTHKWHWYFSQGFTVMLFTFLPFSIAGSIKSKYWKLSGLIAWVLIVYSIQGHKEFRFVLPMLPIALMFSGYSLSVMAKSDSDSRRKGSPNSRMKRPSKVGFAIFVLLATNIPMALYMSLVHQRGTEDVMIFLSKEAQNEKVKGILFLMPCHATPFYSTLHYDLPMRILDCSPSEEKGIPDESDHFMMDPVSFVSTLMTNGSLPSHVVLFASEEKLLRDFLISHSFTEIRRFFHAHFKVDRDLQASVVVYALAN